jgi:hypothetical protein
MSSDDLRAKNASLHDRIEQVIEMHPELRALTEAKALSQDLHVEVGAPFLERTRGKLRERVRTIIKQRPELASYFADLPLTETPSSNASPEAKLIAALEAHMALRVQAEELIAAYVAPESDRATLINALITLFDGPQQREAQRLAAEALESAQGV